MASTSTELVRPDIFDPTPIKIPKAEKAGIVARQFRRAAEQFRDPPGNPFDFAYAHMEVCGQWFIDARRDGHIADNRVELAKLIDWYAAAEPNELDRTPYDLYFDFSGAMFGCLSTKDKAGNLRPFGREPEGFTMFRINAGHRDLSAMERLAATCEFIASVIEADANTTPKPIKCDPGTRSVYIDGMQPFRGLDEVVFAYVQALAAAWPDRIPFHKVQKTSIHLVGVKENRIKEKLPRQLKSLVKATRGLGTKLEI